VPARYRLTPPLLATLFLLLLTGCGSEEEVQETAHAPVPIEHGDECHVCGMIITNYPGPKAESFIRGSDRARKFCSTRDLFAFLLQPENATIVREIYVHDMAETGWEHPEDTALVDARSAWYVANHPRRGAMGPTLASFAQRVDAEVFVEEHGGLILRFEEVTLDVIGGLNYGPDGAGSRTP